MSSSNGISIVLLLTLFIVGINATSRKKKKHIGIVSAKGLGDPHRGFHRVPSRYDYDTDVSPTKKPGFTVPAYDYYMFPENYVMPSRKKHRKRSDEPTDVAFLDLDKQKSLNYWTDWHYSNICITRLNDLMSPVDIPTDKAKLDKNLTALFVYSKYPKEKTYYVTTQLKEGEAIMEAISVIRRNDDVLRDVTYISGLGSWTQRFFESALIMFRTPEGNPSLESNRSLHKLKGTEFHMEVVLLFSANGESPEKTQIHVLVNVTHEDNPVWTPIIDLLRLDVRDEDKLWEKVRHEGCTRPRRISDIETAYSKAYMNEKRSKAKMKKIVPKDQNPDIYLQELLDIYDEIKGADDKSLASMNATIDDLSVLSETIWQKEIRPVIKLRGQIEKRIRHLTIEMETAEQLVRGDNFKLMTKNVQNSYIATLDKKKKEKDILERNLTMTVAKQAASSVTYYKHKDNMTKLSNKIRELEERLVRYQIGPEFKYKSVAEFKQKLDAIRNVVDKYKAAKMNYKKIEEKNDMLKKKVQRKALIREPFQISWLLPPTGGYYMYKGSGVIPPCNRRAFTIVMEKQITISRRQMQTFLQFPTILTSGLWVPEGNLCDPNKYNPATTDKEMLQNMLKNVRNLDKIKDQVPFLQEFDMNKRNLLYCQKNLQFMEDDGFHMLSKLRRRLKHQKQN